MTRTCPKCGHSNPDGTLFCDCGYLLVAEPDIRPVRVEEPASALSREPSRPSREPLRPERPRSGQVSPALGREKRKTGKGWEFWLSMGLVMVGFRLLAGRFMSPVPADHGRAPNLTQTSFSSGFSLPYRRGQAQASSPSRTSRLQGPASNLNGPGRRTAVSLPSELRAALDRLRPEDRERSERLQIEAREIALKYLTDEEYGFLYERNAGQSPSSEAGEETARIVSLKRKLDAMATAAEKKKIDDANEMSLRLLSSLR
jgi:hypothetical protein